MAEPSVEERVEWRKWAGESEVFDGSIVTRLLEALEDAEGKRDKARDEAGRLQEATKAAAYAFCLTDSDCALHRKTGREALRSVGVDVPDWLDGEATLDSAVRAALGGPNA